MPELATETRDLYLELLKRALMHTLYWPPDVGGYDGRTAFSRWLFARLRRRGITPLRLEDEPERRRTEGRDWPVFAHTMVGRARLDNVHECIERVLADDVPGDLIEAGVWRGGSAILMRGVLRAHDVPDRAVYVADSFAGLPPPDPRYPADATGRFHTSELLRVSQERVADNFRRYDLLDDQVRFLPGRFAETLPAVADRTWAVVRLDGDMYESTMDGLMSLYPGLAPGGYLIVDDYSIPACRRAVDDYRRIYSVAEPLEEIDWTGVYWRREAEPA